MMLNLAIFSATLFFLKLTRPPTPFAGVFAKILPMISKKTSDNFPQRNPILVVPGLRRDPKHEPMDGIMLRNPILLSVGLRCDPKPEQMENTKCMIPLLEVIGLRCGPKHKRIDDAKHIHRRLIVIRTRRDRNQNPLCQ